MARDWRRIFVWSSMNMNHGLVSVCSWMNHEGNELLFLRLEAMCEGLCEDLALRMVACYLKHLKQNQECHDIDVDDMNDIFIVLLYKFNKKQEVTDMVLMFHIKYGIT